ncbi:hypothetical protein SGLAM104S_00599 [Streptomyces glaucescens]
MPKTMAMMSARKDSSSTLCAEMYRKPSAISRTPARRARVVASGDRAGSRYTAHTVTHSARASMRYSSGRPITGISTPASSGPMTWPVCMTVEPSALAAGSWSAGTSRAMEALRAGELRPQKACWTASRTIRAATESSPVTAWSQNRTEVTAMPLLVIRSSLRRSMVSATAPPHSANTISGSSPAMCSRC